MSDIKKSINTRIVLRNDTQSNWNNSTKPLLKGEVGVAYTADGKAELRFGTTDGLSAYNDAVKLQISADQVAGLTDELNKIHVPQVYEATSEKVAVAEIIVEDAVLSAATFGGGDVLVVKNAAGIASAYHYDKDDGWHACDGNVDASKVILTDNFKFTYTMGKHTASSASPKDVTASGTSIQAFLQDAFAETLQPTITNPTASIDGSDLTAEIGQKYSLGDRKLTFNEGSYQYDPKSTKISVAIGDMTLYRDGGSLTATNDVIKTNGGQITLQAETTQYSYLSGGASYTYKGTCSYSASPVQPKTNIGTTSTKSPIAAGSCTVANKVIKFTGNYPAYWGFTSSPKANPTAITANNGNVTVDNITYTRIWDYSKTSFAASDSWYELFYIVPAVKRSSSGWTGKDSNNVDLAVDTRTEATVTFADGQTAKYYVYVVRNAAKYSKTTCSMTFK